MKMKSNSILGVALLALAAGLTVTSCHDDETSKTEVKAVVVVPEEYNASNVRAIVTNRSTGVTDTIEVKDGQIDHTLEDGLYNFVVMAEGEKTVNGKVEKVPLRSVSQGVVVTGGTLVVNDFYLVSLAGATQFVIAEVGLTSVLPEGVSSYNGDQYFRIFNNSADTLYADGLCIFETEWNTVTKYTEYDPDIQNDAIFVGALYRVPGSGKDKPVAPYESILICDVAKDHTVTNPNSWNLSDADYEWYDETTGQMDVDVPEVNNLLLVYKASKTIWIPNKQGNTGFGIGFLPEGMTPEKYVTEYELDYSYLFSMPELGINRRMNKTGYYIPNEWVSDFVTCSPSEDHVWNFTSQSIDAGYVSLGKVGRGSDKFGKAARRKVKAGAFVDTNNSSSDFEVVTADPHYKFFNK